MTSNDYLKLVNGNDLVRVTKENISNLKIGTLIGLRGRKEGPMTAAYPVFKVIGEDINFVLFKKQNGTLVIDNTFLSSEVYVNNPPIIVPVESGKNSSTFGNELSKFFG